MDLTQVLPGQIWSDILESLDMHTDVESTIESNSSLQSTLLDNVKYKRYKKPIKTINVTKSGITTEVYKLDGKLHRYNDKPAIISYGINGEKFYEGWYQKGLLYRDADKGPKEMHYIHVNKQSLMGQWRERWQHFNI